LKKYSIFTLLFLASCAKPLVCPLIWPFGFPHFGVFRWMLFIALVAIIAYLIFNAGKKKKDDEDETPLSILKKRYAKGEITREEYKRIKKEIDE
jgi:putative membrane protein